MDTNELFGEFDDSEIHFQPANESVSTLSSAPLTSHDHSVLNHSLQSQNRRAEVSREGSQRSPPPHLRRPPPHRSYQHVGMDSENPPDDHSRRRPSSDDDTHCKQVVDVNVLHSGQHVEALGGSVVTHSVLHASCEVQVPSAHDSDEMLSEEAEAFGVVLNNSIQEQQQHDHHQQKELIDGAARLRLFNIDDNSN